MSAEPEPPGKPGIDPTWSSSAKDAVSTALGTSRIWATFGHGIVNEVYWPSTGHPQIRDLGFIVAGPDGWTELKRAYRYSITTPQACVPLPHVVHEGDGFRLELEFLVHPLRDVLMIRHTLYGDGFRLYALLAPHLAGARNNSALAGEDLLARDDGTALCLRSDAGFSRTSVGYAGFSDGWQDFARNGAMTWTYRHAGDGNIAMMGELPVASGTMALGFAETPEGARTLARSSLADDYDETRRIFVEQWENWARTLSLPDTSPGMAREAELSATVIKVHEDRTYAGAIVASLSVPWGNRHDDTGGYHLVWTRDTVEASLAMIAVGQVDDALRTLDYLIGTQADDGSWPQNYFPDGRGYWSGRQLDEVALPILLAAKLNARGRSHHSDAADAMVGKAAEFLARNGPISPQDRWEENAGASPFTLAVSICALVAASEAFGDAERDYLLSLADSWNECIEEWTYSDGGPYCADYDVDGYYVRLAPPENEGGLHATISVRNRVQGSIPASDIVGLEFLYLVRTGLRAANDKRVTDTVKVIDAMLRADTPSGPCYYRYNGDGYGEHEDGSHFDGTGVGRPWPLLTGERGHYAVAAGEDASPYLDAMTRMTSPGGLIPEQIWDSAPIPELGLEPGKPAGSAMPLVWAHAEFLKLLAAQANGRPAELLDAVENRYGGKWRGATRWHWRETCPFRTLPAGRALLIEATEPFVLHSGRDGWDLAADRRSAPTAFGFHGVEFTAAQLAKIGKLKFTFYFPERDAWRGVDFEIAIGGRPDNL
ncbi:glycoside hydrolase family 15 protein [Oricola nitratireducens]|uniref:glycoside hydrolase family 15 protein n=1 Tax=Oricola nitratireducens TaxID=2775868 RepID=UPI001869375A|nr:glycoside hydrolase family 15 protein [Oricola nitratireducens]